MCSETTYDAVPGIACMPGAGDQARERGALLRLLTAAAEDERRHADRAEDVADVGLVEHPERAPPRRRGRRRHACTRAYQSTASSNDMPSNGQRRTSPRPSPAFPSRASIVGQLPLELGLAHAPRVVRRPGDARSRVAQHEPHAFAPGASPANMQPSGPPSASATSTARSLPDGVQHRAEVVHPLLDRRQPVRRAGGRTDPCRGGRSRSPGRALPSRSVNDTMTGSRWQMLELGDVRPDQHDVDAAARAERPRRRCGCRRFFA